MTNAIVQIIIIRHISMCMRFRFRFFYTIEKKKKQINEKIDAK